jgi:CheY-like chemotaxis protein
MHDGNDARKPLMATTIQRDHRDPTLSGIRVLIVDDDPIGRKLTVLRFRDAGSIVAVASTAEEALQLALSSPPDAIVCDIRMTGMDGFQFQEAVAREATLARIPVVLVSSGEVDFGGRGQAPADERPYLLRTPDMRQTIDAVAAALRGHG